MAELRAIMAAPLIRGLESLLPVPAFLSVIRAAALIRTSTHVIFKRPKPLPLPSFVTARPSPEGTARMRTYLNRTFEYIPDRLNSDAWRSRCRFVGLDPVREAMKGGRPIVFAFAHFGPYLLLRSWLNAAGIPMEIVVNYRSTDRTPLQRMKNRWAIAAGISTAHCVDQLSGAIRRFKEGRPLAIAIDVHHDQEVRVPVNDGWTVRLATGAIRLARRNDALLFPCSIQTEGPCRLSLEVSPPVPPDVLQQGDHAIARDIITKLMPRFLKHPDEWSHQLVAQFVPPDRFQHTCQTI